MSITPMDTSTFEQNLIGLKAGGKRLLSEAAQLTEERDALRDALSPMPQYVILCLREARQDGAPVSTIEIAERDLERAQKVLANLSRETE